MNFISDISLWWLFPWLIISIAVAYFLYRKKGWVTEISATWRWTLIGLRTTAIFIIGVLFIGLLFHTKSSREEKPVLILVGDNSSSMLNYKDSALVKTKVPSLMESLQNSFGDEMEVVRYSADKDLISSDTLNFEGRESNHAVIFEQIHTNYYNRNIGGIVFVSDGNFNKGANPLYEAEKISITPIFTVGVGDTVLKRDQLIKNIAVNEIAFLNNKFPVVVDVEANKMGKIASSVQLLKNGKVVAHQNITYANGVQDFEQLDFELEANEVGFHQYVVQLKYEANEYNIQNNRSSFTIEVIDSRNKILLLSSSPHPDLGAIRSVLEKNENYEVDFQLADSWNGNVSELDLIVCFNPGAIKSISQRTAVANAKVPIFIVTGESPADFSYLKTGIQPPVGRQTDEIQVSPSANFQLFQLNENLKTEIEKYPPLKSRFGQWKISGQFETLLRQKIGPVIKEDAMMLLSRGATRKMGFILGEGVWQWKMSEFARTKETKVFDELIGNSIDYLLLKGSKDRFRVHLPKRVERDEDLIVNASFFNASLQAIGDAKIGFHLKDEAGKERKLQFGIYGEAYRLNAGTLSPGQYTWKASTQYDGTKFTKEGVFVVRDKTIEQYDTRSNHTVLKQLANGSNGQFFRLDQSDRIKDVIRKREDIRPVNYMESSFNKLIDYWFMLLILLLVLSIEWWLRRWFGSY